MRVIQLGLIDTDSSTHSLSVLLSAVETSPKTQTALRQLSECRQQFLVQTFMRRVYYCGYYSKALLFLSELSIVCLIFEGGI